MNRNSNNNSATSLPTMTAIRGCAHTLRPKKHASYTATQRLEALELAEHEERDKLRSKYAKNYKKGQFSSALPNRAKNNIYYRYFVSDKDDAALAEELVRKYGPSPEQYQQQDEEDADAESGDMSPAQKRRLDKKRKAEKLKAATKNIHIGKSCGTEDDRFPPIDITSLQPNCAQIYVKYQKVYDFMAEEDKEFFRFRKEFLEKERQRKLNVTFP